MTPSLVLASTGNAFICESWSIGESGSIAGSRGDETRLEPVEDPAKGQSRLDPRDPDVQAAATSS